MKTTAILKAKPGKATELDELLRDLAGHSRREPGNLRWDLWQAQDDPETFVIDELYKDDAAVLTHRKTAHFANYASKVSDLALRTAVTSHPLDVG